MNTINVPKFSLNKQDSSFLRIFAGICIVLAHCCHFWVKGFWNEPDFSSVHFLSAVYDQFTRFTVPLFLFLSGFGLTLRYTKKRFEVRSFLPFRLKKIGIPFLIWTFFCSFRHIEFIMNFQWSEPFTATLYLFKFIFITGFDYQFYFVILIFQLYLLYPLLLKPSKSKVVLSLLFIIHLFQLSPIVSLASNVGVNLPILPGSLFPPYLFYFMIGMYAAWNSDFLVKTIKYWSIRKTFIVWLLTFILINTEFLLNRWLGSSLSHSDHFNRVSIVFYNMAMLALFIKIQPWLRKNAYHQKPFVFLFQFMAPYSFFLYLAHTHILRLVEIYLWEITLWDLTLRGVYVVIGTFMLAWGVHWLLEDYPKIRYWLGLPHERKFELRFPRPVFKSIQLPSQNRKIASG